MTAAGSARTWQAYGPLVEEGQRLMSGLTRDQLALMRDHLVAIRELTDRHRERLLGEQR
jgi:hypothetical protein